MFNGFTSSEVVALDSPPLFESYFIRSRAHVSCPTPFSTMGMDPCFVETRPLMGILFKAFPLPFLSIFIL